MFATIAPRYDVSNTVLSLGIHHLWRRVVVRLSEAKAGMSVLDCATGTGDLALAFKRAVGAEGSVMGTDFCAEMMETAPDKATKRGLDIRFEVADAMNLHYPDNTFDIASISFGIRNVDVPAQALREMARVVRPSGRVVVLEFGQPKGFMGALYRFYSNYVIPFVGGMLTGNKEAYSYLNKTAAQFPSGSDFDDIMRETGMFARTSYKSLTFGIAFVYVGEVR